MRSTQRPTATGIHVRSTRDANVLFHAVACGILPMVTCRLDAADRAALAPGCVYVWEERHPAADATGAGMERFTEGRHWHPSRVRDDFLIYVEKDLGDTDDLAMPKYNSRLPLSPYSASSLPFSRPATRREPLVKQTYSVWVNKGEDGLKKWHLNAYYSENALKDLLTVDDVSELAELVINVPHECYKCARAGTSTSSASSRKEREMEKDKKYIWPQRRRRPSPQSSQSDYDTKYRTCCQRQYCQHKPRYAPYPVLMVQLPAESLPRIEDQCMLSTRSQRAQKGVPPYSSAYEYPHWDSYPRTYQSHISFQHSPLPPSEAHIQPGPMSTSTSILLPAGSPPPPYALSPVSLSEAPPHLTASKNVNTERRSHSIQSLAPQLAPLTDLLRFQAQTQSDRYSSGSIVTPGSPSVPMSPMTVAMATSANMKARRREPEDEKLLRSFRPL